jgi:hypothetical protein
MMPGGSRRSFKEWIEWSRSRETRWSFLASSVVVAGCSLYSLHALMAVAMVTCLAAFTLVVVSIFLGYAKWLSECLQVWKDHQRSLTEGSERLK